MRNQKNGQFVALQIVTAHSVLPTECIATTFSFCLTRDYSRWGQAPYRWPREEHL